MRETSAKIVYHDSSLIYNVSERFIHLKIVFPSSKILRNNEKQYKYIDTQEGEYLYRVEL